MSLILAVVSGCTSVSDVDIGDDPEEDLPDVTGEYACAVSEISGCEDEWAAWASQDLTVSGDPGELSFAFADGPTLEGAVDDAFGVEFGGTVTVDATQGTAEFVGVVFEDDGRWTLQGDLTVEYPDCTLEAVLEADEVVP